MQPLLPLRPQMARQFHLLGSATTRLSLTAVVIPSLSRQAVIASVLAASTAADVIGVLDDSSIGLFTQHTPTAEGMSSNEDRFLPRLQAALRTALCPSFGGDLRIWFRSVHRWSTELRDSDDLVDLLLISSARVVGIGLPPEPFPWAISRAPAMRPVLTQ